MAGSGKKGADTAVLNVGADRERIEDQFGAPTACSVDAEGDTQCTYQFRRTVPPSADRAGAGL